MISSSNNDALTVMPIIFGFFLLLLPSGLLACPGSPVAGFHSKCEMTVSFPGSSCEKVMNEITDRASGKNGWIDPHNGGTYTLLQDDDDDDSSMVINGSRLTGNKKYTDLFDMSFVEEEGGCVMQACSESQVRSYLDFSTNYCNLHSLYCNSSSSSSSGDNKCSVITHEFDYVESFTDCWQNDASKCVP
eukprot:CAMPEP_0194206176 /NCGR_PEP_ID=MMETSP0156-20130528/5273_1 /TAXON_ID=33649 /ORGANISM="Thalassionema nitzschioides, Strain L26-B" /LENGTH=188 /DNA_ID=CAMNT_0038932621 /DNA_START=35 /DNA_END=597 /DNA_ORIENTATION=+